MCRHAVMVSWVSVHMLGCCAQTTSTLTAGSHTWQQHEPHLPARMDQVLHQIQSTTKQQQQRARALLAAGRSHAAEALLLLHCNPACTDAALLSLLGDCCAAQGRHADALSNYRLALAACSDGSCSDDSSASCSTARVELLCRCARALRAQGGEQAEAGTALALQLLKQQQQHDALAQQGTAHVPVNPAPPPPCVLLLCGAIAAEQGHWADAARLSARALAADPGGGECRKLLARVVQVGLLLWLATCVHVQGECCCPRCALSLKIWCYASCYICCYIYQCNASLAAP